MLMVVTGATNGAATEGETMVVGMTTAATVKYSNGRTVSCSSYAEALAEVRRSYPGAEIGHEGDLTRGGDRTLCWASAGDAANDDGARACASITHDRA